jgi:hypothetical protein
MVMPSDLAVECCPEFRTKGTDDMDNPTVELLGGNAALA